MSRLLILGLPITKSILYDRHVSLKSNILKRSNYTFSCISRGYKAPVEKLRHESFHSRNVGHQATRRRILRNFN